MVDRLVDVDIALQTTTAPVVSFPEMFLSTEVSVVPSDKRIIRTTKIGYPTDLPSGTNAYNFANAFWTQKRTAQYLYIGRWVNANAAPYYVSGATSSTTLANWIAVSDGTFTITDDAGTPNTDDLTGVDLTGVTTLAGLITALNAELSGIGAPNITGLGTALFSFDNTGRLILTHSVTGAAAATLAITSEGTGTDLTTANFFNIASGFIVSGQNAEEPTAAVTAIRNLNDVWYKMAIRSETAVQQMALAAQFEALDKQVVFVTAVAGDKDPASTADNPYLSKALDYKNTSFIYTEHTITSVGGWVDAYSDGAVLPAEAGSTAWSNEALVGAYSSGKDSSSLPKELTSNETGALEGKNCNYIMTTTAATFMIPGYNSSGDETRIVLLKHWAEATIQGLIHAYNLTNPLPAFDDKTLNAYEGYTESTLYEALARGGIVDTAGRPIVLAYPSADDFTATQRSSGTMTLSDVFSSYLNHVVNKVIMTGEFRA